MMRVYGLIGEHLGHSFSKSFFEEKFDNEQRFDCRYKLFELPNIYSLKELLRAEPALSGFNVTIPYKQQILPFLDEVDPEAERVGAVNTVRVVRESGEMKLIGYNTDVEGFRRSLAGKPLPSRALVLGTGGAAAAVSFVLEQWQVPYRKVSRNPKNGQLSYAALNAEWIAETHFIINCTPVGMWPLTKAKPNVPFDAIGPKHFLYDLIYNPLETAFLQEGRQRGARIQNGLDMLHLQAEASWQIWND